MKTKKIFLVITGMLATLNADKALSFASCHISFSLTPTK